MSVFVDMAFLDRTVRIKYGKNVGSGVYVQFGGVCMIITAAHIADGMQVGDKFGVRFKSDWVMVDVTGVSRCNEGNDVCAIRPRTQWGEGLQEEQLDSAGILMGEEVAYCGFPLDLEMYGMPGALGWPKGFIKSAILSGAITTEEGKTKQFVFDTINNRGFSGGPIIRRNEQGKLRVVGIVSGYKYDAPAPIYQKLPDGTFAETADYFVKPNSGFMIGVPIRKAVAAAQALAPTFIQTQ